MIFNKIRNFIEPSELEIHIYKTGIYIINYTIISNFSDKKIRLENNKDKVTIVGNNLVISRLQKDELFISGDIKEIFLGD